MTLKVLSWKTIYLTPYEMLSLLRTCLFDKLSEADMQLIIDLIDIYYISMLISCRSSIK